MPTRAGASSEVSLAMSDASAAPTEVVPSATRKVVSDSKVGSEKFGVTPTSWMAIASILGAPVPSTWLMIKSCVPLPESVTWTVRVSQK